MPMKYFMFSLLASIVIPGLSSSAGMPYSESSLMPGSSEFTSHTSGGDIRQSTADPSGFDSGFWRAEYLTQEAVENETPDDPSIDTADGTTSASTALRGQEDALDSLAYSDKLAMTPIEIPIVTASSELQQFGNSAGQFSTPTMSDWEYAAVSATTDATIGFTTSGPSATSAIVGFVGIMIVIGAYASSSGRKS